MGGYGRSFVDNEKNKTKFRSPGPLEPRKVYLMIRRDVEGGYILITQDDHAALSYEIMERWGNKDFETPTPRDEILLAIKIHDAGWREWDAEPKIEPESGHPANFMEMSTKDQSEIWERCYKAPGREHSLAGTIIALHFAKFNQSTLDKDPDDKYALSFKRCTDKIFKDNLGIKLDSYTLDDVPSDIKVNLKLLQIGDIISLTLCHGWKSIEINDAPLDYVGSIETMKIESEDGFKYTVDPYPFSEPLLNFTILCRRLVRDSFSDDSEYREALEKAEWQKLYFELREKDK